MLQQYAPIDQNTSGDRTLVAATAGSRIRITSMKVVVTGAVTLTWKRGTTALSGAESYAANGRLVLPLPPTDPSGGMNGYFETAVNEAFVVNLGGNVQVSGHLTYVLVP